jgi:hypothetical protein
MFASLISMKQPLICLEQAFAIKFDQCSEICSNYSLNHHYQIVSHHLSYYSKCVAWPQINEDPLNFLDFQPTQGKIFLVLCLYEE